MQPEEYTWPNPASSGPQKVAMINSFTSEPGAVPWETENLHQGDQHIHVLPGTQTVFSGMSSSKHRQQV